MKSTLRSYSYQKLKYRRKALQELEKIRFPVTRRKNNVVAGTKPTAFALGEVMNFSRGRVPSRFNKMYPELHKALQDLAKCYDPHFSFTTIQVNKNVVSIPHVDKNNVGGSICIALGDFTGGGDLVIQENGRTRKRVVRNRFVRFNGSNLHWVTPFTGLRYSLVYFTHNFGVHSQ